MNDFESYGMSKNDRTCIGPCYEPKTVIVHPLTLELVTNNTYPFCPTNSYIYRKDGKDYIISIDECANPTMRKDLEKKDLELNMLLPYINFNCGSFLRLYYDINTFYNAIDWVNTNTAESYLTKMRIIDCALNEWGNLSDFVITDGLVEFYSYIIKKHWIKYFYPILKSYIVLENNEISLSNRKDDSNSKYKTEKINYIIKKIFNKNTILKILMKYRKDYLHEWKNIESHNDNIKRYMVQYIKNEIK